MPIPEVTNRAGQAALDEFDQLRYDMPEALRQDWHTARIMLGLGRALRLLHDTTEFFQSGESARGTEEQHQPAQ
jgi:hypothetical protein